MSQALIIAGMHRSGTSLVAELFNLAGVHLGSELLPADQLNPHGYFEDVEMLTLQREMVAAAAAHDGIGWPDWGWTEKETLREDVWQGYEERARQLVNARSTSHPVWGWKEPRTTLLLDFWKGVLPNARYVLVVREPWAVAESVRRLPAEVFRSRPDIAPRIWMFYNRRLLAFAHAHPDSCVILPIGSLTKTPHKTLERITNRFGLGFLTHDKTACFNAVHAALARAHHVNRQAQAAFKAEFPEADELWQHLTDLAASQWTATPRIVSAPEPVPAAKPAPPPRVSIIVPCFNDGVLLLEAIESIETCHEGMHETIIVNDGSTDPRTLEILASLEQRGYRVLHGPNEGVGAACNRGVREAAGDLILPIGADNRLRPVYVSHSIEILDADPAVGVVYGDPQLFGDRTGHQVLPDFDARRLHVTNFIDACAVFRKKIWTEAGGFDAGLRSLEDWDFWLTASEKGWKFHHLPYVTFDYRIRADSLRTYYLDPQQNSELIRYIASKHPYYAEHHAEVIGDLHALYVETHNRCQVAESETARREHEARLHLEAELTAVRAGVAAIERSLSWKITAPLRACRRLFSGVNAEDSRRG